MNSRININVSATDYDNASKEIRSTLMLLEEMVHGNDEFFITDSEYAFGWHFFVVSVNLGLIQKLAEQMGEDFYMLKGKSIEKKFLTWFTKKMESKNLRVKFAIKEEMESSRFGIF